jgi:hypothetical protein
VKMATRIVRFRVMNEGVSYIQCVSFDIENAEAAYIDLEYGITLSAEGKIVYVNMNRFTLKLKPMDSPLVAQCPGTLKGVFEIVIPRMRLIKAFMKTGWRTPLHVVVRVNPYDFAVVVLYKDGHWETAEYAPRDWFSETYADKFLSLSDIEPKRWEKMRLALGRLRYMIHHDPFKDVYELIGWSP